MNMQTEPRQAPLERPLPAAAALTLSALLLLLGGCAGQSARDADGSYRQLDPNAIPDAVPRVEPRSKYGNMPSYAVRGRVYHTKQDSRGHVEHGLASWYGLQFNGHRTSSGEPYDMYAMTAAHKTLPLPSYARITNLENGRSAVVRINDRGPFHATRVIDLSYAAATKIGVFPKGTATVEIRGIDPTQPRAAPSVDSGLFLADTGNRENKTYKEDMGGKADDAAIAQSLAIASRGAAPRRRAAAAPVAMRERAATAAFAALDAEPTPARTREPVEETAPPTVAARVAHPNPTPAADPTPIPAPATERVAPPSPAPATVATRVPRPRPAPAATARQDLYLQVGAFGDPRNAERLRERLSPHLAAQVRIQRPVTDGSSLYKVRVGPLDSEGEARRLSAKLSTLGVSEEPRLVWN